MREDDETNLHGVSYKRGSLNMDDFSDDSDDIFNDKVTDKIDEINKAEAEKFAALDKLTSPDNFMSPSQKLEN